MIVNLFYDQKIDGQNYNGFPTGYKSDIEPLMNFESNLAEADIKFNVIMDKNHKINDDQKSKFVCDRVGEAQICPT